MKAIRRSLKGDKEQRHHQSHNSIGPKSAIAIVPPKKVIKALYDYEPQNRNGQELAFHKGDFFHVLSRENDTEWYEACNPLIPDARGLVPVAFFEVIGKQQRQSDQSVRSNEQHDSGFSEQGMSPIPTIQPQTHTQPPSQSQFQSQPTSASSTMHSRAPSISRGPAAMVYGIILYDFTAERPDELEAKMGEAIIVVAQSNPEWFVAKPIGRLGGPGLIPVSFVDIKDTVTGESVTDPLDAVRKAGVPKVEEWKKTAAEYKNSSITLGRLDQPQSNNVTQSMQRMSVSTNGQQQPTPNSTQGAHSFQSGASSSARPVQQHSGEMPLAPVSASVPRYCFDNDMYWYIIECQMEDGRWFELSRYYADFYDFQIKLLEAFPEEAGNRGKPRTLPFMPGPVAHVTDAISNGRRQNLDEYIKQIVDLPNYISKSMLVRNLFKPKPGLDFEIDPNVMAEEFRLSSASQQSLPPQRSNTASRQSDGSQPTPNSGYGGMPPPSRNGPIQSHSPFNQVINGRPPLLHTQASTLTQNSTTSSIKGSGGNAGAALKIKVHFKEEIIIIRVPQDISYQALKERLIERLKVNDSIKVQYKDEASNSLVEMSNDDHLEHAIAINSRLQLHVSDASG